MQLSLSALAVVLGTVVCLPQVYGLTNPDAFATTMRKFPRSTGLGYGLMAIATAWFVWNVRQEPIADFAAYKSYLLLFFAGVGLASCIFVQDFLAVRGLAVLLLLLAKLMVDTARWVDTPWRLVIVIWAYLWVIAGMWFTISPWRLRDLIDWATADASRVRVGSAVRLAFGLFVVALGLTAYRST